MGPLPVGRSDNLHSYFCTGHGFHVVRWPSGSTFPAPVSLQSAPPAADLYNRPPRTHRLVAGPVADQTDAGSLNRSGIGPDRIVENPKTIGRPDFTDCSSDS